MSTANPVSRKQPKVDLDATREKLGRLGLAHASEHVAETLAEASKDRPAVVLLQWFVNEQMEEESTARAILGRIRLGGTTGVGLLMIDQELAKGNVPGVPAATPGTPGSNTPEPPCASSSAWAPAWIDMRPATALIGASSGRPPRASVTVS